MAKAKGSLIPMRGSVEDWGPGKHQRNLESKEAYARKMREQATEGPPNFAKLLSAGVEPSETRASTKRRTTKRKATKRPAARKRKKKTGRGRR